MYKIRISSEAKKNLKELKSFHREIVGVVIDDLKENPFAGKALSGSLVGKFSYKLGVYRIIYKIIVKDNTIEILSAGHRSSVYN